MRSFQFSIRIYIKESNILPFTIPSGSGSLYLCHWLEDGSVRFEGIQNGYEDLLKQVKMKELNVNQIEYFDRILERMLPIRNQYEFEGALRHSAQSYSLFSMVIKVHTGQNEENLRFPAKSKPRYGCIREWLMSTASTKSSKYKTFSNSFSFSTNQKSPYNSLDQSSLTMKTGIKLELIDEDNERQKMLNEKMMMDPVISMILFNEYIPLARREREQARSSDKQLQQTTSKSDIMNEISKKVDGLTLNQADSTLETTNNSSSGGGLFIRSDLPQTQNFEVGGGLFLRSGSNVSTSSQLSDDWVMF